MGQSWFIVGPGYFFVQIANHNIFDQKFTNPWICISFYTFFNFFKLENMMFESFHETGANAPVHQNVASS